MFIKEHRKDYPIGIMCRLLSVSRSGYHRWIKRRLSSKEFEDKRILEIIVFHYKKSKRNYGLPRIHKAMRNQGLLVNKKRISRLMRANNIKAKTKRKIKVTTVQNSRAVASENILKQNFTASSENKIWTGDITHIFGQKKDGFTLRL